MDDSDQQQTANQQHDRLAHPAGFFLSTADLSCCTTVASRSSWPLWQRVHWGPCGRGKVWSGCYAMGG